MTVTIERTECLTANPVDLREVLKRVDEIHRSITKAVGRIEFLKLNAERANSRLTPVSYGRGVERSRIEYSVLESDAERWGISQLKKELDELLEMIRPLVDRLPPGVLRAVALQRIVDGIPCGLIARRMHFSRGYVYKLLLQVEDRLCEIYGRELSRAKAAH
ncbi:MAG: hypothetical protein PHI98_07220 [Eubacteriales bacterium]|nr:hypothetical protein [Eubacteriales bacterium]